MGYDVLGVEFFKIIVKIVNDVGVFILNDFFNLEVVEKLGCKFFVINVVGVFFYFEEFYFVMEGIWEVLVEDGVFVV